MALALRRVGLTGCEWACTAVCAAMGTPRKDMQNVSSQIYLLVAQNCAWARQKGSKVQRTHWTGVHARRGLRMSCKGLQTHWGASEYLRTTAESQTYLVQLCTEPCVSEGRRLET